jgi:hypothetical protein
MRLTSRKRSVIAVVQIGQQGTYTDGCEECGGGAMEHPCLACAGKCGNIWKKMLMVIHIIVVRHTE